MFVSGLRNEALFKKTTNCSDAQAHEALRKCAEELRDTYIEKQQKKPEQSQKLGIKAHATEVLLCELGSKVPENPEAIRESIRTALTRHAKVLQGHENLLSKKGNTYTLMMQTAHLMEWYERPSLLRYHDLKDKLLRHDSDLKPEVKEAISAAAKDKTLTLQDLETIDERLRTEELSSGMFIDGSETQELLSIDMQKIQDRYKQRHMQMDSKKPRIKTKETALTQVNKSKEVPKDPDTTREAIASALDRHTEALQAHEQLLSKKGNAYSLMEQTRHLRQRNESASLMQDRYQQSYMEKPGIKTREKTLLSESKEVSKNSDAITAFIKESATAIDKLSRPEGEKAELLSRLLTCKNNEDMHSFHMALQQGGHDLEDKLPGPDASEFKS